MDKTYKSLLFDDEKIAKYAGQEVLESLIASREGLKICGNKINQTELLLKK